MSKKNEKPQSVNPGSSENQTYQAPVGLLGGELDFWGKIGLGMGASPRARELIVKGMLFEKYHEIERKLSELKRKPGRPKEFISIDVRRASAVLGAAELALERNPEIALTQKAAIEIAQQIDKILVEAGERESALFDDMTTFARIQTSVSRGLSELDETGKFSKK